MARIKKRGTSGNARNYITRTQAVRKLQISLPDFRRLCIFKGIYPREPRNKKKASKSSTPSTTFYYSKDIQYLLHEPLLNKFRDHKALAKKIGRALGRGEVKNASRLEQTLTPKIALDHIIKERYPTFVDALRDLDDALSMLFLFANLPSTTAVPPKTITLCQRLCLEFQHYLITTHSLRKSFLSIKGIYYQATIQGQDILWLVPYKFVQRTEGDIDFRIMGTFVEFYTTLLGFVNFRLYTSIGLVYPPRFNTTSDEQGAELDAFTLESKTLDEVPLRLNGANGTSSTNGINGHGEKLAIDAQAEADKLAEIPVVEETAEITDNQEAEEVDASASSELIDTFEPTGDDADVLEQPSASSGVIGTLFRDLTFFLSRETPRQPLEFLLKAFGCKRIGWDAVLGDGAFTTDRSDRNITHEIVDRPNLPVGALPEVPIAKVSPAQTDGKDGPEQNAPSHPGSRVPGRIYIQPQWVWDCVNMGKLLRPDLYAPGATLPPHLSPWVKPSKGEYNPTVPLVDQELEGEAEAAALEDAARAAPAVENGSEVESDDDEDEEGDEDDEGIEEETGMMVAGSEDDENEEDDDQGDEPEGEEDDWDGVSAEEDENDANDEVRHQLELEAEALGLPAPARKDDESEAIDQARKRQQNIAKRRREAEEQIERQKMMMPNKKRKMYEKMRYSNNEKDKTAEKLRAKRRAIEKSAGML